jgi:hypothetical protein
MPRPVESASLFPSRGKFIAGGDDMWVRLFDIDTGDEIGEFFVTDPRRPSCCWCNRCSRLCMYF